MKLCSIGLKREQYDTWINCGELFYNRNNGGAWINLTAMRVGLLQGRLYETITPPVYLSGDIYAGTQWVGFINTTDAETGTWYTITLLLIPFVEPSRMGIVRLMIDEG